MSEYGNVPEEDVQAMNNAAQSAARVIAYLPGNAPSGWRDVAYEFVLGAFLGDWVDNTNGDWDEDDEENLVNLLQVTTDIALQQEETVRDIAFRTLLKHAMNDWVENW